MPQKKHKPEEIVAKLRQVDVLFSQGRPVAEAIRAMSVTAFTYYRWRKAFGGLKSDQVKRLNNLKKESVEALDFVSFIVVKDFTKNNIAINCRRCYIAAASLAQTNGLGMHRYSQLGGMYRIFITPQEHALQSCIPGKARLLDACHRLLGTCVQWDERSARYDRQRQQQCNLHDITLP